jgi:hypothetical protein
MNTLLLEALAKEKIDDDIRRATNSRRARRHRARREPPGRASRSLLPIAIVGRVLHSGR